MELATCTVSSKQYLPLVLTMIETLRKTNPGFKSYVLLSDVLRKNSEIINGIECFYFDDFLEDDICEMYVGYSALEYNTALKPVLIDHVIKLGNKKVLYLDSDLLFKGVLGTVLEELNHSGIILTPHKIVSNSEFSNVFMIRYGAFNSGFLGVNSELCGDFVSWWKRRCKNFSLLEPEEGFFVDQKWLDLVPSFFDKVHIERSPKLNVAYWNLEERMKMISIEDVVFFHLSGYLGGELEKKDKKLSKHSELLIPKQLISDLKNYDSCLENNVKLVNKLKLDLVSFKDEKLTLKKNRSIFCARSIARKFFWYLSDDGIECCSVSKYKNVESFPKSQRYHSDSFVLKVTRLLGSYICGTIFSILLDKIVPLFRVLGRNESWLKGNVNDKKS